MRLVFTTLLLFSFLCLMSQNDTIIVDARSNNTFNPAKITIKAGQTVLWRNTGGFHNVNGTQISYPGNPEGFSNGDASNDAWEFAFTFTKPGFYQYRCDPHFSLGMTGEILVLADVIITEIMYNPPEVNTDVYEYVELYNNGSTAVNLKDYRFVDGITFTFPGFNLGAGEYVILAEDEKIIRDDFGLANVFQYDGALDNGGEALALVSQDGDLIDEVEYANSGQWPAAANGNGASLVLCDFTGDNNDPENWVAATTPTGVISNGVELLANPGAASQCPGGPVVKFVETEIQQSEDLTNVSVRVSLNEGAGPVSFTVSIDEDQSTAINGEDFNFSPASQSISISESANDVSISFMLVDDMQQEGVETIVLKLTNPSAGASIDPNSDELVIRIIDNDGDTPFIVISEIMYNDPGTGEDVYEFIELYNNSGQVVNLEGFTFTQGIEYTFPNFVIQPEEAIILAKDADVIESTFEIAALEWTSGTLSNTGETIELQNPGGATVDIVTYSNSSPWDELANGNGPTLDLCDVNNDNNVASSWQASVAPTGVLIEDVQVFATPGELRAACSEEESFPRYPVGLVTTNNKDGVPDSILVATTLRGVVHGINYNANNDGLSFTIIDEFGDGINVFSSENPANYEVTEGDEVDVVGRINQFNGLTQIAADNVILISTGNRLEDPILGNNLGEDKESQLIRMNNLTIIDPGHG